MSEVEFWGSTYAKVIILYETVVVEPRQRSDYFVALIAANLLVTPEGREPISADDILAIKYRVKKRVIITVDPDLGAVTDLQGLRAALKGKAK